MAGTVLAIDLNSAEPSAVASFLDSIATSRGVTSLMAKNFLDDDFRLLASKILENPHFADAVEVLDLSWDFKCYLNFDVVSMFISLFSHLSSLGLRGCAHTSHRTLT
jgi:hypothetical protein